MRLIAFIIVLTVSTVAYTTKGISNGNNVADEPYTVVEDTTKKKKKPLKNRLKKLGKNVKKATTGEGTESGEHKAGLTVNEEGVEEEEKKKK